MVRIQGETDNEAESDTDALKGTGQIYSVRVSVVLQQICWRFEARGFDIMKLSDTHT